MLEIRDRKDISDNRRKDVSIKTMKKLKFPIMRGPMPEKKRLSMDDYLKFVNFHLKYTFNEAANREWKKLLAVGKPFSIG